METAVIDFLFSALAQPYAAVYRWAHAFAAHVGQNRGAVADGRSETVQAEVKAVTGK